MTETTEKTKLIAIELARLVREVKTVVVRVPAGFDGAIGSLAHDIYSELDDGTGYAAEVAWGADEGTHALVATSASGSVRALGMGEPEYVLGSKGRVRRL